MHKIAVFLKYYESLSYPFEIFEDRSEGDTSYVLCFPDLPGCMTAGNTIEDAVRNSEDAKENWLMAALEDGIQIPEPHAAAWYRSNTGAKEEPALC